MTNADVYPCYVKIVHDVESDDVLEIPTEENGTILLSTIQAQFPHATGLKYKSDDGEWNDLVISDDALNPPDAGWGEKEFFVTPSKPDTAKRKTEDEPEDEPAKKKRIDDKYLSDLIVLGLPYAATEDDVKSYFEKFGELDMHEIKRHPGGKSKGFGFVRFKSKESAQKVLKLNHSIGGRRCDVRLPKKQEDTPTKLFIGKLKEGTTTDELREHFSAYGNITDVYIPTNFRGFGFVTFESQETARDVMGKTHMIKGSCVNVNFADPKGSKINTPPSFPAQNFGYGGHSNFNQGYGGPPYGGGYSNFNKQNSY